MSRSIRTLKNVYPCYENTFFFFSSSCIQESKITNYNCTILTEKGTSEQMRTPMAPISLRIRAGRSGSSISAYRILDFCRIKISTKKRPLSDPKKPSVRRYQPSKCPFWQSTNQLSRHILVFLFVLHLIEIFYLSRCTVWPVLTEAGQTWPACAFVRHSQCSSRRKPAMASLCECLGWPRLALLADVFKHVFPSQDWAGLFSFFFFFF